MLLASAEQGLKHALDRFAAAFDQEGMKISTKKTDVLCLSRNPNHCTLQVNGKTLQQVEMFKNLEVVFTVTEGGARRSMHGLVKQTHSS